MKALQSRQRRDSCLLVWGISPSEVFLLMLLTTPFPGEKRFHKVILNVIYFTKSLLEVCKWEYTRRQELFQRILRRATVGSHCCFCIFSSYVCMSAYSYAERCTVCVLGEKQNFKVNFKSQKITSGWKCDVIYTKAEFTTHEFTAWCQVYHGMIISRKPFLV